jgi:hypothetical protein
MMEEAVQAAFQSGQTTEATLRAIFFSEQINKRNYGAVVKPWEVDELPEEFVLAYQMIFQQIGKTKHKQRYEGLFRDFRQKHGYRNYLN